MTIEEILKDFIDTARERLKTPISGAFLWSFVIYNWRPIFLLMFSKASIEDKIIVINHEYCNFWAIFFPVFIALFYTLLIPKIMLSIDKDLFETKKERVNKKYDALDHLKEQHIRIAKKEYEQKNVESGSKEKQDFMDEIASLKEIIKQRDESLVQIGESNKKSTDQLNHSLELSNALLRDGEKREQELKTTINTLEKELKESKRSTYFSKEVSNMLQRLNLEDSKKFMDLIEEENGRLVFRLAGNRKQFFNKFWTLKLVEKIADDHYIFTDLGSVVYNILHLDSQLSEAKNSQIEEKRLKAFSDMVLKQWNIEAILSIKFDSNGIISDESLSKVFVNELINIGVFDRNDKEQLILTSHGKDFIKYIREQL